MRDPARTRQAAREQHIRALQQALSCVSSAVWITAPRPLGQPGALTLTLSEDAAALRLVTGRRIYISAGQHCRIVADEQYSSRWHMQIDGYVYSVRFAADAGGECFSWHWHPTTRPDFHSHVSARHPTAGDLSRFHVPAGPTTFATVARFLIVELDVRPLRADWQGILNPAEPFSPFG